MTDLDDYDSARAEYLRHLAWWPRVSASRMREAEALLSRRYRRAPTLRELAGEIPELRVRLPLWERMIAAEMRLRGSDDR